MNARQKMDNFLNRKKTDCLPCLEWASWWDKTIMRWKEEGLDTTLSPVELKHSFGLDYDRQYWVPNILKGDTPKFREDGFINNEDDYEKIRPYLYDCNDIYALRSTFEGIRIEHEEKGDITWLTLRGFFWFPRELFGIEDHLYSFYDMPELYHRICEDMIQQYILVIDEVTKYMSPQFMTFAEDMSYNLGPMLSKDTFDEFIKPYYKCLIPILKSKNISVFVDSDGDVTKMIPWLKEAGVDGVLPLERQAGVDVDRLTAEHPDFLFLGGFDKMVMKHGEEAIKAEFERIAPAIARGNYLPSVDHQTPPDVSLENYRIYVKHLKTYCKL